jgi:hypothetical protein
MMMEMTLLSSLSQRLKRRNQKRKIYSKMKMILLCHQNLRQSKRRSQ